MVQPEDIKENSSRRNDQKQSDGDSSSKSSHAMFKSLRRLDDCRICGTLEMMGETDLYVNHISESVIGCHKFQAMSEKTFALKQKSVSDAVMKMLYLTLFITENVRSTEAISSV